MRLRSVFMPLLGALGCAVVGIVLIPGIALGAMLVAGSHRTVFERAKSPDGWNEARVQFDDAGAVSRYARIVFVKHSWNLSDSPLLSCRAFWGDGEAKVHVTWVDSSTLLIEHHFAPGEVEAAASHCGAVRVITRAKRPHNA